MRRHLWGVSGQASWILKPSVQMLALRHDVRTIAFWAEDLPFLHEMIACTPSSRLSPSVLTRA